MIKTRISWKQTGLISLSIFLVTATILGVRVSQLPTQVSPRASAPQPTPIPINITQQPQFLGINPTFSKPQDVVRITGTNLGSFPQNATITIANTPIETSFISDWQPSYIDLTIPSSIPANQVATLTLTQPDFDSTSIPLLIYDPQLSLMLGSNDSSTNQTLWVKQAPPNSIIFLELNNPISTIQTLVPDQNSNDTQFEFLINTKEKVDLLSTESIPDIKSIQISSLNGQRLPFFIHPLDPLIQQFE